MTKLPLLLFQSLAVHLLLSAFLYWSGPAESPRENNANRSTQTTEIEILERSDPSGSERLRPDQGSSRLSAGALRSSNNFSREFVDAHRRIKSRDSSEKSNEQIAFRQVGEEFGSGGGDFKQIENGLPLQMIAREVDGMLYYPSALIKAKLTGGVNVKLFFAPEGGCDWRFTQIDSTALYFRVYILALVKKLCSLDQIKNLKLSRGRRVDLSFNFHITKDFEGKRTPPPRIVGNVALFEREVIEPPFSAQLGPLKIYGPYVGIDFLELYQMWDDWLNERDPLEEFR